MRFFNALTPETVLDLQASSKKQILAALCRAGADKAGADFWDAFGAVWDRERWGACAPEGESEVVMPRGRVASLRAPVFVFARLDSPVDFRSFYGDQDGQSVRYVFLALTPSASSSEAIEIMTDFTLSAARPAWREKWREAGAGAQALFAALQN